MRSKVSRRQPLITERIAELGDWRGEAFAHYRKLIKEAAPNVTEEWKLRGVPVLYDRGMICTGESYKAIVKITFAKGASVKDLKGLFNSRLDGNVPRAIDLHEGEKILKRRRRDDEVRVAGGDPN